MVIRRPPVNEKTTAPLSAELVILLTGTDRTSPRRRAIPASLARRHRTGEQERGRGDEIDPPLLLARRPLPVKERRGDRGANDAQPGGWLVLEEEAAPHSHRRPGEPGDRESHPPTGAGLPSMQRPNGR